MYKYFLSIIFILAIFQSFRLFDESFFNAKEIKKSYNIISISQSFEEYQSKKDTLKEVVNIEEMLKIVNIRNCKRLFNKYSSCHDVSSKRKIKVGPPIWKFAGRELPKIEGVKYSNNLKNFDEIWDYDEFFYFIEAPKKYISGTKINLGGIPNEVDRADLIAYQSSLK